MGDNDSGLVKGGQGSIAISCYLFHANVRRVVGKRWDDNLNFINIFKWIHSLRASIHDVIH